MEEVVCDEFGEDFLVEEEKLYSQRGAMNRLEGHTDHLAYF